MILNESIEALADGFLQRKKEFYDCRCILRQGYTQR